MERIWRRGKKHHNNIDSSRCQVDEGVQEISHFDHNLNLYNSLLSYKLLNPFPADIRYHICSTLYLFSKLPPCFALYFLMLLFPKRLISI